MIVLFLCDLYILLPPLYIHHHLFSLCVADSSGKEGPGGASASQPHGGSEGVQGARGRQSPTISVKGKKKVLFNIIHV